MKRLLLAFIPLICFVGCEVSDDNDDSPNTSYNCTDNDCFSADGGSGQYATLDDCLSVCGNGSGDTNNIIGEFCFEIEVNSSIDAFYSFSPVLDWGAGWFYLTGDNTSATITPPCYTLTSSNNSDNDFDYSLEMAALEEENGCSDIEIRVFQDGNLIDTENILLGCIEGANLIGSNEVYWDLECESYCSIFGNTFNGASIIQ